MKKDFSQIAWGPDIIDDTRQLIRLAVREDLGNGYDWTTVALVPEKGIAAARLVARQAGIVAGLPTIPLIVQVMDTPIHWEPAVEDGDEIDTATCLGTLRGPARDLLTSERLILNFVGRLSGIASLTHQYVARTAGTPAHVYDTRKTCPGYRRLEKYAVRCGGGCNHRCGLYDAILIKDNHLAFGRTDASEKYSVAQAVKVARDFVRETLPDQASQSMIIEIEVDTLDQLRDVLPAKPDIVLLDNMTTEELRSAVALRHEISPETQLEASGGINLNTIEAVATTGVDRISVGALTHSAPSLDVGLDWITN